MKEESFTNSNITPIGRINWRNDHRLFGIKDEDRMGHIYVVGKTGTGKSTLLENMAISDISRGNGICVIDPHGDIATDILNYIPESRIEDVIYFNPIDKEFPIAFNPLIGIHPNHHNLVASGLISTFKKIWADSWGPRMEYILRFSLLTLLENRKCSLLDIQPLLTDQTFRNDILSRSISPYILTFWHNEFDKYSPSLRAEAIAPILNKIGIFLASTPLRNIVGQKIRGFNLQDVMNEGKILIANLSKGELGEDVSAILGNMLVTNIQLAALYRARHPEHTRKPFYLYVDEMHSFVSLSFVDILAEARKYRLSIFLSHQYIEQLHEKIRSAIFGNVGTLISFRIGAIDAEILEKEFKPVFDQHDLISLPKYSMYLKLMIDGATSQPFSALTISISHTIQNTKDQVVAVSRQTYGTFKSKIEEDISTRYKNKQILETSKLF
jgi:energy-coupling factor transporter ATP-binding protein EcfA2